MKSAASLLLAVAATAALVASPAQAAVCIAEEITQKLMPIVTPAMECQDESKFSFIPPSDYPTPSEIAAICTAAKCKALIEKAETLEFPTCEIPLASGAMGIDKLFKSVASKCKSGDFAKPSGGSGNGTAGGSSGSAGDVKSPPILILTNAPAGEVPGKDKDTKAPVPTSPKSAATASVVAATGAMGVAVALSLVSSL
ncbi:hypothetical protein PINS_up015947 [Pythium insidiosum]|nr:hypothetical protein PINS_up015947 [Pythium insidiosum]